MSAGAVEQADRLTRVIATDWDACAGPGNPFTTSGWVAAYDDFGPAARIDTGHLILRDREGVVMAALPCHVEREDPHWVSARTEFGLTGPLIDSPHCVAGSWSAFETEPRGRLDDKGADLLLAELVRYAGRVADRADARLIVLPALGPADALASAARRAGWREANLVTCHILDLSAFTCIADWTASLSKKSRQNIRLTLRGAEDARVEIRTDWCAQPGELARMLNSTSRRYSGADAYPEPFLAALRDRSCGGLVPLTAWRDGTLLAVMLLLIDQDVGAVWCFGRAGGSRPHWNVYRLLWIAAIETAFVRGVRRLNAGRGLTLEKRQMGFRPVRLTSFFSSARGGSLESSYASSLDRLEELLSDGEAAPLCEL